MRKTGPRRLSPDVLSGGVLAALGCYVAVQASQWELMGEDGPGPGFFPFGYGMLIVALSVLLILRAVAAGAPREAQGSDGNLRALLTWAVFAAAAIGMHWIGFVLGLALLSAFVASFVFGRGWRDAALTGLGCAAGFWLVFGQLLGVELPAGPWGF